MAVWCTNTSAPPLGCEMKPKPFSALNHLTVPVATVASPLLLLLLPIAKLDASSRRNRHCDKSPVHRGWSPPCHPVDAPAGGAAEARVPRARRGDAGQRRTAVPVGPSSTIQPRPTRSSRSASARDQSLAA